MAETGTIRFFNEQRGFGFITRTEGDDLFVHISNVVGGVILSEGQTVSFEVGQGRRGPEATDVRVV